MAVYISNQPSDRRIVVDGVHKGRMLKVLASNAKPNKKLRDVIAAIRARRA
jgi:hypothetical protein